MAVPTPVPIEQLPLATASREDVAAAVLESVRRVLGEKAGIALHARGWQLDRRGPRGARRVPVGTFGHLRVPAGLDARDFGAELAVRLADYEVLEQARDRAVRMSQLYEAAQDFSADLDLDRTLDVIVLRGRTLTGADLCYLSMNDFERGATYIQTASGLRTEAFKNLRLGYGEGLGGLVAKEGRPYFSSDYRNDARFVHTVDPQVEEEGVVSVLGVPLKLDQRVIGVLFVGRRHESTFEPEEVSFLEALGDHAALAIENARLYGRLDRVARLHGELTTLLLTEHTVEDLEERISDVLGVAVRVEYGDTQPTDTRAFTFVRAGPMVMGRLVSSLEVLDDEQRMALEHGAQVVAVHLLKEREVTQARLRTHGELLDAWLSGSLGENELIHRARSFGLDLARSYQPVVFRGDQSAALRARVPAAFVAGRQGNTVALLPKGGAVPDVGLGGLGPVAAGPRQLAASVLEATRILAIAEAIGRTGIVSREQVGVYALLLDPTGAAQIELHARSLLAPLVSYDLDHDSTLVRTLEVFLDAQGSAATAAKLLNLHVNSLYYRLTRIREVLRSELDDPEERLQLHLACRVIRLQSPSIPSVQNPQSSTHPL